MDKVRLIALREAPLSIDEVHAAVADPTAGGICVFVGTVRNSDDGRDVTALDYSSHPSAEERLHAVAAAVADRHDIVALAAVHRTGGLAIGDLAVVVAASAAHRAEAFAACRDLIDALKADVPIWKHQSYPDGTASWSNSP